MNLKKISKKLKKHNVKCNRCDGTGNELYSMYRKCEKCNGTGEVMAVNQKKIDYDLVLNPVKCGVCNGTGRGEKIHE